MRAMELETLDLQLKPLSLRIVEIPSDGNCLYRAVAAQCGSDYIAIRKCISVCVGMWARCSDWLVAHMVQIILSWVCHCRFTICSDWYGSKVVVSHLY
jgi:hypothetical protein